jgi:hypothetical protein
MSTDFAPPNATVPAVAVGQAAPPAAMPLVAVPRA